MAECRTCHAEVRWVETAGGKRMPLDAEPDPERGNVRVGGRMCSVLNAEQAARARELGEVLYLPHHVSCPDGESWRRKP